MSYVINYIDLEPNSLGIVNAQCNPFYQQNGCRASTELISGSVPHQGIVLLLKLTQQQIHALYTVDLTDCTLYNDFL